MDSVGILGYGRFGKVLANLLADDFIVNVHDIKHTTSQGNIHFVSMDDLLSEKNIFICVPIRCFEDAISNLSSQLLPGTTIIDTCSVKIHPVNIMKEHLPTHIDIIATHPLFGPDSISAAQKLNFMMYSVRNQSGQYPIWKRYFTKKAFNVIEITPEEHDKQAAESQGVVHFVSRFLKAADLKPTSIDTLGFQQVLQLVDNNCNDSLQLFLDLQRFNPYSKGSIEKLESAFKKIKSQILNTNQL